jgi:hypothetical protein
MARVIHREYTFTSEDKTLCIFDKENSLFAKVTSDLPTLIKFGPKYQEYTYQIHHSKKISIVGTDGWAIFVIERYDQYYLIDDQAYIFDTDASPDNTAETKSVDAETSPTSSVPLNIPTSIPISTNSLIITSDDRESKMDAITPVNTTVNVTAPTVASTVAPAVAPTMTPVIDSSIVSTTQANTDKDKSVDKPADKPTEAPKSPVNDFNLAITTSDPKLTAMLLSLINVKTYTANDDYVVKGMLFVGNSCATVNRTIYKGEFTYNDSSLKYNLEGTLDADGLFNGVGKIRQATYSKDTFKLVFENRKMDLLGLQGIKSITNLEQQITLTDITLSGYNTTSITKCKMTLPELTYPVEITLDSPLQYHILMDHNHQIVQGVIAIDYMERRIVQCKDNITKYEQKIIGEQEDCAAFTKKIGEKKGQMPRGKYVFKSDS